MATELVPTYWHAGEQVSGSTLSLSLQDPGWLYGATVFTTVRVYDQSLAHPWTAWAAHRERLARSLQHFGWTSPPWARVERGASLLAQTYPVLRITLFPDGREVIWGRSLPPDLSQLQRQGIVAWVADSPDYGRSLAEHKTGNYLGCWLALQSARRQGAAEAILINPQGHWLETSTGNLWGWDGQHWWTPPLAAGILPGVMRSRLLQGLQAQGRSVIQRPWMPEVVVRFITLAYANSVREVIPIHTVLRGTMAVNYNPDHGTIQPLMAAWR